jgi:hypothetical protein
VRDDEAGDDDRKPPAPDSARDTLRGTHIALRKLLRNPLLTATALLTLAVGIGATTAVFGVA